MNVLTRTVPLGEIAELKSGGTPNKAKAHFWGGDFPWVSAKDLKTPIINDSIDRLTQDGIAEANIAPKNSLLILVRGMTLYKDVPVCITGRDVAFNQDIKALIVSNEVTPLYLLYYLKAMKSRLRELVDSAGHGTGRLNSNSLERFPVIVPSVRIQHAIADLLSTWDQAIEKTERLIAAKEKRFIWLQNNLIRKSKLQESWSKIKISDVCNLYQPRTISKNELNSDGQYKVFGANGVIGFHNQYNHDDAEVVITCRGATCGTINFTEPKSWITGNAMVIKPKDNRLDRQYLFYFLKTTNFNTVISGAAQPQITRQDLAPLMIILPPIQKQNKIAHILIMLQQEIDLLKKQLEAYSQQKRGLMQKLLTGQWRVKINS
jgi:type I restriction enzyme, S subunit